MWGQLGLILDRSQFALRKCSHSFRSISIRIHSISSQESGVNWDESSVHLSPATHIVCLFLYALVLFS